MTRSERVALRRDIRRRKACTRQHHLGTPTTTQESIMDVTITIPKFVTLTQADHDLAEQHDVLLTQGIGSLFIVGPLDGAHTIAGAFLQRIEAGDTRK